MSDHGMYHTGPLCTADACGMADKERERLTAQHNAQEAAAKKLKEAEEARGRAQKEKEAEASWKAKEAAADLEKALKEMSKDEDKESQLKS